MFRKLLLPCATIVGAWLVLNLLVGSFVLPPMLLKAPLPGTTEPQAQACRNRLSQPGDSWRMQTIHGGESVPLQIWHLHRPHSQGVAILLHGFGDDAWGAALRARDLPEWDAVTFAFRGRDRHPEIPSTLGAWEHLDVVAVVHALEAEGIPRSRILLVGASQGGGVALLALAELEKSGGPLAGALLECPFKDLADAARNHLKGALRGAEWLTRPAQAVALWRGGHLGRFRASKVSPLEAARHLRTPVSILTGDADSITPLEGVQAIVEASRGGPHPIDLTEVPGAGHCEAGSRHPGGWRAWAEPRLPK